MNQYIKLLRDWLLHFAVLLTGVFLFTVLPYIIYLPVGKSINPSPESRWEYFSRHMLRNETVAIAVFLLLIELNYQYIFKRYKWPVYLSGCVLRPRK